MADDVPFRVKLAPEEIAYFAKQAGFSSTVMVRGFSEIAVATAIALAESGGSTIAHNQIPPDDSYGLWQINMYKGLAEYRRRQFGIQENKDLFDPAVNARAAKIIKDSQGWKAWSTYTSGAYVRHIGSGVSGERNAKPPSQTVLHGEGDLADAITEFVNDPFAKLGDLLKPLGVRVAGFVGGGVLIILAVVLYVRKVAS